METPEARVARLRLIQLRTQSEKLRAEEARIKKALNKARSNPTSEKATAYLQEVAKSLPPAPAPRVRSSKEDSDKSKTAVGKFGDALFLKLEDNTQRRITIAYRIVQAATAAAEAGEKKASSSASPSSRAIRLQYGAVIWRPPTEQDEDTRPYCYEVQRAIAYSKLQREALEIKYMLPEGRTRPTVAELSRLLRNCIAKYGTSSGSVHFRNNLIGIIHDKRRQISRMQRFVDECPVALAPAVVN